MNNEPEQLTRTEIATLDWWTVRECANRWRVSQSTVIRWLESGKLLGKKFGNQWRVCSAAISEFEKAGVPQAAQAAKVDMSVWENLPQHV